MGRSSRWFKVDESEQLCVSVVSLHEALSEPYAYTKTSLPLNQSYFIKALLQLMVVSWTR